MPDARLLRMTRAPLTVAAHHFGWASACSKIASALPVKARSSWSPSLPQTGAVKSLTAVRPVGRRAGGRGRIGARLEKIASDHKSLAFAWSYRNWPVYSPDTTGRAAIGRRL